MAFDIDGLLQFAVANDVSDVFVKTGAPPTVRLNGTIKQLNHPTLTNEEIESVAREMMGEAKWEKFLEHPDHDLSTCCPTCRVSASTSIASAAAAPW
jgi:Tfp pilus assembly pilus retraction ATPase PilT